MDETVSRIKYSEEFLKIAVEKVVDLFKNMNLEPVIIGGMALDAWTYSRATMDLDLLVDFETENYPDIINSIINAGGELDPDFDLSRQNQTRQTRFYISGLPVDLLQAWDPEWKELIQRSKKRICLGLELMVPSLEDLIIQKLRVGRPRDIDDVAALISINHDKLDRDFVWTKIRKFHLQREWEVVSEAALE